jgi:hypothetical protein
LRRAARTDANLTEIVKAYRKLGCSVYVDNGMVDLWAGYGGLTDLVEVKNPKMPPSKRKLTPAQVKFRETWTGGVRLIMSLDDVKSHVDTMRRRHLVLAEHALKACRVKEPWRSLEGKTFGLPEKLREEG